MLKELLEQVSSSALLNEHRALAEMIVHNIDDYGYLIPSVTELSSSSGYPVGEVVKALKVVQTFDPAGIAARDLRECLMLQLERLGREGTIEYRIVSDFMEPLGKRDFAQIAGSLGITVADVQAAIGRITPLDPRPLKHRA